MDAASVAGRSFSDDEVARILARAAELQNDQENRGTRLGEIEQAAAEAGIDPAMVRAAATELAAGPADAAAKPGFFGPTSVTLQTSIEGEVSPDDFAQLNEVLQHALGLPATVSNLGRSVQWSYVQPQGARSVQASVSVRDGRTLVRVHEGLGSLMGGIYGGLGGGLGAGGVAPAAAVGGFFVLGPLGAVGGALIGTALSFFGTRAVYLAVARYRQAQLKRVFDALTEAARTAASARAEASSLTEARARQGLAQAPLAEEGDTLSTRNESVQQHTHKGRA